MRVYELSKQLNIPSKQLLEVLRKKGFNVKSHMSALESEAVEFLQKKYSDKSSESNLTQKETMQKEQVKSAPKKQIHKKKPPVFTRKVAPVQEKSKVISKDEVKESKEIVLRPMTIAEVSTAIGEPVNDLILSLLQSGIAAAINQQLSEEIIKQLIKPYDVKIVKAAAQASELLQPLVTQKAEGALENRLPVVVVLGHVDHGKTTLLDFIRKTRIVAKEKGGITQHLGAYQAKTDHGNLVFLDTPGHEAFPKMRQRGIKVADIAILVVAADDGVMPQTIEVIKHLKSLKIPIIVAINKIDKVDKNKIEGVKRQLAEQDLLPEEWGGDIVSIPISATTGDGVNQLVEMVALQAQLLELQASMKGAAKCYVLESKLEKGRGPVATLICQQGTLQLGDYFVCGNTTGRVSSIKSSYGKNIKSAAPSVPVQVAGFKELPEVGDLFGVVAKNEMRKKATKETTPSPMRYVTQEKALNLIIKTDTDSSREALLDALGQLASKDTVGINLIHSGVGDISEGDVELAFSTGSEIIGFHVKADSKARQLGKRRKVSIDIYNIIYKLLEALQKQTEKEKVVETVRTLIGEAIVRRVFDIKGVGVVAGSYVKDGRFVKEGYVVAWRGRQKIGEGKIISLQREKKHVKEIRAGFECGFVVEGITDWYVDDRAECYLDMPK